VRLSSSSFLDQQVLPTKFAYRGVAGGKNISVPLAWSDAPPETQSYALSMIDPHPVANNWIHWLVINIQTTTSSFVEGASGKAMPGGAKELYNSYGTLGYGGPEPPKGSGKHPYVFTLYALDIGDLDLPQNSSLVAFEKALNTHVLASAKITGTYER
jgi:Raf kinase inhibitor-like YbhB/YbcL family protein